MRLVTSVYTNDTIRVNLKPGDHIFFERGDNVFYHHGIYVGHNRVIHFQGPYKDNIETSPCLICGYAPKREGRLIKTCLDCFCWVHAPFVREYGIPVAGSTNDPWILERLNSQDVGNSPPCPSCDYKPNKEGGFCQDLPKLFS